MHSCLSLSVPLVLTLIFYFLTHCIREFDAKSLLLPLTYFILTLYRVLFIFLILWVGLIISVNITNVVWLASVKERIFFFFISFHGVEGIPVKPLAKLIAASHQCIFF